MFNQSSAQYPWSPAWCWSQERESRSMAAIPPNLSPRRESPGAWLPYLPASVPGEGPGAWLPYLPASVPGERVREHGCHTSQPQSQERESGSMAAIPPSLSPRRGPGSMAAIPPSLSSRRESPGAWLPYLPASVPGERVREHGCHTSQPQSQERAREHGCHTSQPQSQERESGSMAAIPPSLSPRRGPGSMAAIPPSLSPRRGPGSMAAIPYLFCFV